MKKNQTPPLETDRLRRRAEAQLQEQLTRPGQPPPTAAETLRLVHELQIHQIELELQNHALLEMRDQFEQRAEKYADLYDFAPLGYFTLAADETIQELNFAGAALLGQERSRLIGQRFGLFVSIATRFVFNTFLAATLVGTSNKTCEVVLAPEGLPPRFMRLEGIGAVSDADQQCRIAAIDITERKQAEAALQQSEIFIKDILDSLTAHIAVVDAQGAIILVNAAWRRFAEQNGGDAACRIGANYLDVCRNALAGDHSGEAQAALHGIRAVISGAQISFSLEYPCNSPTEQRWFVMRVFPVSGGRQGAVIAHEDITARKQAEEKLRESKANLAAMLNSTPEATILINRRSIVIAANEVAGRRLGRDAAALIGRCIYDLIPPEVAERRRPYVAEALRTGRPVHFEDQRDGMWIAHSLQPVRDADGKIRRIAIFDTDITERRQVEAALRASELRFRTLVELLPCGIQEIDRTGRVTFANPALERLYGPSVGRFIRDFPADAAERDSLRDYLEFLLREQPPPTTYFSKDRHANGGAIDCQTDWTYLRDAHGQVQGFLAVITDITERKRMDEALQASEARFRLLLEQTPSIAAQGYDPDGVVHYWNAAAETFYGYTVQETIGRNLLDLIIPPEMRMETEQAIRQMAATGQPLPTSELSLMRKDGERVAVLSSHAVIQVPGKGIELFCLDMDSANGWRRPCALRWRKRRPCCVKFTTGSRTTSPRSLACWSCSAA